MKTLTFAAITLLTLLTACSSDQPMDDDTRARLLKNMQDSQMYDH